MGGCRLRVASDGRLAVRIGIHRQREISREAVFFVIPFMEFRRKGFELHEKTVGEIVRRTLGKVHDPLVSAPYFGENAQNSGENARNLGRNCSILVASSSPPGEIQCQQGRLFSKPLGCVKRTYKCWRNKNELERSVSWKQKCNYFCAFLAPEFAKNMRCYLQFSKSAMAYGFSGSYHSEVCVLYYVQR